MSTRREDPDFWRNEDDVLAPRPDRPGLEIDALDPLPAPFTTDLPDPLDAPEERTEVGPRPRRGRPVRRRPRTPLRRVKRTLKHVDPLSVLKISMFYFAIFLVLWLFFVAIVYWVLSEAGFFRTLKEVQEGFAFEPSKISLWTFERWGLVLGVAFAVLASLFNLFLAFLYNVGADIFGGIDLTFVERDTSL